MARTGYLFTKTELTEFKVFEERPMKFWKSTDPTPAPQRKRKNIVSELDKHEEFQKLKAIIRSGRMRQGEAVGIFLGPEDAKTLGYKWPERTATDALRKLIKSMGLESDFSVFKYETDISGIYFVRVTYNPPMVKSAQPHAEQPATLKRAPGRPRKTA